MPRLLIRHSVSFKQQMEEFVAFWAHFFPPASPCQLICFHLRADIPHTSAAAVFIRYCTMPQHAVMNVINYGGGDDGQPAATSLPIEGSGVHLCVGLSPTVHLN